MSIIKSIALAVLFLIGGYIKSRADDTWPRPYHKSYLKISQWWLVADQHYTDRGLIDPNVTNGIFNTSLYAEYGLTNRLTGVIYFPFFSRNYFNNQISQTTGDLLKKGEALNSVGDTDISIRYAISRPGAGLALSGTMLLGLPIGKTGGGATGTLQTGDGEFNQMFEFGMGTAGTYKNVPVYLKASIALNNRTGGFSDEFRYGLEIGMGIFNEKMWIGGGLVGVESFKNGKLPSQVQSTSIFANNTEYTSYGFEINYYVTKKVGLSFGYASAFRGEIIFTAPSYSVGVFYDGK